MKAVRTSPPTAPDAKPPRPRAPWRDRRPFAILVLVGLAGALLLAAPIHRRLLDLIAAAEGLILQRPVGGMIAFVVLAALSAMLTFFSSSVLVPVAVAAWGPAVCFTLLWAGWLLGGVATYATGRFLGRPVVQAIVRRREALARYERLVRSGMSLPSIVLLQLALPSDVGGYLFGLVRCRFTTFVAALAIAELPYAAGAVYLGVSFLEKRLATFLALGAAGAALSLLAWRLLRRRTAGEATQAGRA
ncbi:MAG TPA: VTT domain-containing protein [Gemmatimonadales bacterium]|nr:VTT domain-containing protein [Gemmatimonadales bacterium]